MTSHGRRNPMEDDLKILNDGISQKPLIGSNPNFKLKLLWPMTKACFENRSNEDDLQWRRPQNIESGISQQPFIGPYSIFKLRLRRPKQSVQILQMKTISIGRRPQNIKNGISQQPLFGSYSNFKLKLRWPNYIVQIL